MNLLSSPKKYKTVLTIAGSDSGGGAGIQADIKTFSAHECYALSVITALTAQNTVAVKSIQSLPVSFVQDQLCAVLEDISCDAVKIGMLNSSEIIEAVAVILQKYKVKNIVVDPVMIAKSGDLLLQEDAIESIKANLFPLADIITPNIPEASTLLRKQIETRAQMQEAAYEFLDNKINFKSNLKAVLIKGGHLSQNDSSDCLLIKSNKPIWFEKNKIYTKNTHGTGCTLSSAIAANLAKSQTIENAVKNAHAYVAEAILSGSQYSIGNGHGPVHHFHEFWE